jgi:alanine-glyoxylate transaminase/serine-glyoxylate transaminase/serine-pyruvate transaminase
MSVSSGRNFLHTPGPTNIPERVLRAMLQPAVDFTDPDFLAMTQSCFADLKKVFRTESEVICFASNGHGAWEAALVNTLSPGDKVLVPTSGHFTQNWAEMAEAFEIEIVEAPGDWRHAIDPDGIENCLRNDREHAIKAVLTVHTDTATGITSDLAALRRAIDNAKHPALYMVDTVAALGTVDFRMDEWGIDVAVGGSQKGLMQPPGLAFNAASAKSLEACKTAKLPRLYWDWERRLEEAYYRWFCGTPPEHLLFALREGLDMVLEEGLENAFDRHRRLAEAVRRAVAVWSRANALSLNAIVPEQRSNSVTTILVAEGYEADKLRMLSREKFDVSLGSGLGETRGKAFRIGHMGYLNEPMILGALAGVEASLEATGIPHEKGGVDAAVEFLASS